MSERDWALRTSSIWLSLSLYLPSFTPARPTTWQSTSIILDPCQAWCLWLKHNLFPQSSRAIWILLLASESKKSLMGRSRWGVGALTLVMVPTALVRPSRKTSRWSMCKYSGVLMKRKCTVALSPVRRQSLSMLRIVAVWRMLPQCTVNVKHTGVQQPGPLVEWASETHLRQLLTLQQRLYGSCSWLCSIPKKNMHIS